jgi:glutaredoxin 3
MILYIKSGCPWCVEAERWLGKQGIRTTVVDVISDPTAYATMRELSGQSKAPVLVTDDARVLADFGVEELPDFLKLS